MLIGELPQLPQGCLQLTSGHRDLLVGPLIAVTELGGKVVWLAALQAAAVGYLAGAFVAGRARVSRAVLACDLCLLGLVLPLLL